MKLVRILVTAYPCLIVLALVQPVVGADERAAETPLAKLSQVLPDDAAGYRAKTVTSVRQLVPVVERWTADMSYYGRGAPGDKVLQMVRSLCDAKEQVDLLLQRTISHRTQFVELAATDARQERLRSFLACTAALTDLSGRLRYLCMDAFSDAAYDLGGDARTREQLMKVFLEKRNGTGAAVMVEALFDPAEQGEMAPVNQRAKGEILQLIRDTRQHDVLPQLAEFVRLKGLSAELTLLGAHTIRHVGLPQDERPGRDPTLQKPEITAQELYDIVMAVDTSRLQPAWTPLHTGLVDWLDERRRHGVMADEYRLGSITVRAGDWLLMKNPSPYNLFTDLYPGLFTHVGVVTVQVGSDGKRRFVLIDLPETGSSIPAVTVDTFVKRTLDYVFLRHIDRDVALRMAKVAESVIGNESRFDLNFRTEGIESLKGQDLAGKKIEGYCAGVLLLCAQETGKPRSEFFPIPEHPAGGRTLDNLAKLDVSMERDFLSPTGPLFSPSMQIAGRREPMYSPKTEIEQAVYDHFAKQMRETQLVPSPDWYQSLRLKLAEAARGNPSLAQALADAAGVNRNMDLVAAAKLGAVVQTLDVFAYGASRQFREARDAFRIGGIQRLRESGADDKAIAAALQYRQQHADMYIRWEAETMSARQLRIELVAYYIADGKRRLDERFFHASDSEKTPAAADRPRREP